MEHINFHTINNIKGLSNLENFQDYEELWYLFNTEIKKMSFCETFKELKEFVSKCSSFYPKSHLIDSIIFYGFDKKFKNIIRFIDRLY